MGEPFSRKRFPHTPSKKLLHNYSEYNPFVRKRTVGASVTLALAIASGQAPPRPCPLRGLLDEDVYAYIVRGVLVPAVFVRKIALPVFFPTFEIWY